MSVVAESRIANDVHVHENSTVSRMDYSEIIAVADEFVLQYYTVMNKCPELLHRFYEEDSAMIYESAPVFGQLKIYHAFCKMSLIDTRVLVHKVDALKANKNSILVQVSGEISVNGGTPRRFMRSFTLCEKCSQDFYVLNDIFQYQDRVYIREIDNAPTAVSSVVPMHTALELENARPHTVSNGMPSNAWQKAPTVTKPEPVHVEAHLAAPEEKLQPEIPVHSESPAPPTPPVQELPDITPEATQPAVQASPQNTGRSWAEVASAHPPGFQNTNKKVPGQAVHFPRSDALRPANSQQSKGPAVPRMSAPGSQHSQAQRPHRGDRQMQGDYVRNGSGDQDMRHSGPPMRNYQGPGGPPRGRGRGGGHRGGSGVHTTTGTGHT